MSKSKESNKSIKIDPVAITAEINKIRTKCNSLEDEHDKFKKELAKWKNFNAKGSSKTCIKELAKNLETHYALTLKYYKLHLKIMENIRNAYGRQDKAAAKGISANAQKK